MGILDKVKNLFTEEYEEEVPIKKEVKHVEITPPRRETPREVINTQSAQPQPVASETSMKRVEPISDSTALNREEKFKFPVYFDDEDFEDLPKKEIPKKVEIKKEEPPKVEPYKAAKMVEEKRNFKPSPIISPVYGVLDKNYKKEDIVTGKERVVRTQRKTEPLNIDEVRKKAFGTLEDDLESTLISSNQEFFKEKEKELPESEIDIFKELEEADLSRSKRNSDLFEQNEEEQAVDLTVELELQKQKIDEIDAYIKQNTVKKESEFDLPKQVENTRKEDLFKQMDKQVLVEDKKEDLENGDLFDLIDSMYEKRDEA
jgi:hypothetical protein